jgi:predicted nuclease of predicted toxin-antitoxin system
VAERLRFHLDEQVDPDIAHALHRYGIDVTTTNEVGLRTYSDRAQLEFSCRERRVIVTHDTDFLRIAQQDYNHPGIAYCHTGARSIGTIIRNLIRMYETLTPDQMVGQVEYL